MSMNVSFIYWDIIRLSRLIMAVRDKWISVKLVYFLSFQN